MARILRRAGALLDLLDLYDFITEQAGEELADAFIRRFDRRLHLAAEYPLMGRQRDDLYPGLRSVAIDRYLAFYLPLDDGIDLVRVIYGGRDLPPLFAEAT